MTFAPLVVTSCGHSPGLTGFPAFLAQKQDRFFILSTGHATTGLDYIVKIANGHTVRMTHPSEDLVFDEG
ncbi:hypothetical protein [Streptomyces sp. ME18-1-4]|uniref:hypothetical protein n=1 Tax=Streptomyces sp. ME18-1-4 TaxID=3028685 RepID=UPI0029B63E5A|nr:hypothetical protein [Streptomyces sp. ME18-1-4]MDX3245201.1 hypothetical protein [Streptomyces sp. ME18-1-4]